MQAEAGKGKAENRESHITVLDRSSALQKRYTDPFTIENGLKILICS